MKRTAILLAGVLVLARITALSKRVDRLTALVLVQGRNRPQLTTIKRTETFPTGAYGNASGTTGCPIGTKVTGGGATFSPSQFGDHIMASNPSSIGEGWDAGGQKALNGSGTLTVYALCTSVD